MRNLIFLWVVCIIFAGCSIKPLPVIPTQSNIIKTLPASKTPQPWYTLTRYPTRTGTPLPPPLVQTVDAAIQGCQGLSFLPESYYPKYLSPDGQWIVVICQDDGVYTKIARVDGSVEWKVPAIIYKDEDGNVLNPTYYVLYRWSSDNKHVYLSTYFCCIDGPSLIFDEAFGIYKFNLFTGKFDMEYHGSRFSLSPSEKFFAFLDSKNSPILHIRYLISDEEDVLYLKPKYVDVGMFEWSPDERNLLFVGGLDRWFDQVGGFSLFLYNLDSQKLSLLIDNDLRYLVPNGINYDSKSWDGNSLILAELYRDKLWQLNITTRELTPYLIPAYTPTP